MRSGRAVKPVAFHYTAPHPGPANEALDTQQSVPGARGRNEAIAPSGIVSPLGLPGIPATQLPGVSMLNQQTAAVSPKVELAPPLP